MLKKRKFPRWFRRFMQNVSNVHVPMFPTLQLSWRITRAYPPERIWSAIVSPLPVEHVGAAEDGERTNVAFQFDIEAVRRRFHKIIDIDWCNCACDFNVPHVTFRGIIVSRLNGEDKFNRVELHCMSQSRAEEEEVSCYVNSSGQIRLPHTEEWFTPEVPDGGT